MPVAGARVPVLFALSLLLPIGAAAQAPAEPKPGQTFRDCADCPEMVVVPAGRFTMGSPPTEDGHGPNQTPQHSVTISRPFAAGTFEITREDYARFVEDTKRPDPNSCWMFGPDGKNAEAQGFNWRKPGIEQTEREPVLCVSWDDAKDYVQWLARKTGKPYRLLTEAEWEYAARGGTAASRWWGDAPDEGCRRANSTDLDTKTRYPNANGVNCHDGFVYAAPVGTLEANPFGLHDMLGNAIEWTEDCAHMTYDGAPNDGSAWTAGADCGIRIARGGSWRSVSTSIRAAFRSADPVGLRDYRLGFRVARAL